MKKILMIIFASSFATVALFQNCSKKDFTQDTANPKPNTPDGYVGGNSNIKIVINEYPKNAVRTSEGQVVDYAVIPVSSTLKDVTCTLDGTDIPCDDKDRIELKDLALGAHTFEIHATNEENQAASEVITWTLYNKLSTKMKDIPLSTLRTADIIINIDNSYSMADIQTNMANRISNLLNKISALDSYKVAVITTEPYSSIPNHAAFIDGQFNKYSNNSYCLTKGVAGAANMLGNLVQREESLSLSTSGNGYERGIYTTYRAIERSKTTGSPENTCLRQNVPKHVILISDENESRYIENDDGTPDTSQPLSNLQKSDGDNLINLAATTFGSSSFTFHSIIINPLTAEGVNCLAQKQAFSAASRYGTEYAKLSQKTGGVIGSVCAADYSTQLGTIGDSIIRPEKIYGLDCVPSQIDGSWGNVKRISNGASISSYKIEGNKIEFTADLPNDTYRVTYYCYE